MFNKKAPTPKLKRLNLTVNEGDTISLETGKKGKVIHKYKTKDSYEVEFESGIKTVTHKEIRKVSK